MSEPPKTTGVVITLEEMYRELRATHETVAKLAQSVDRLPEQVLDHESRLRTLEGYGLGDHDARLNAVERAQWMRSGVSAALASLVSSGIVSAVVVALHR